MRVWGAVVLKCLKAVADSSGGAVREAWGVWPRWTRSGLANWRVRGPSALVQH